MDVILNNRRVFLVNVHALAKDLQFMKMLEERLLHVNASNCQVIPAGDWNVYLGPDIDCMGYRNYKTVMCERLIE